MIVDTLKERMRRQIVDGYMQLGAPRESAQEIADLTLYAFEQAAEALKRVAATSSSPEIYIPVLINATQIAGSMFTDKAEDLVEAAKAGGFVQGDFDVGGVPQ